MGKVIILLLAALLLAGCATGGSGFCDIAKPIRPAKGETATLSDTLVEQLRTHNATGEKLCRWTP